MNTIDWKSKLTSRKFWAAVAGFVTLILTAFGLRDNIVAQVTAIIMAGATVIAYIFGEGLVDSSAAGIGRNAERADKAAPPETQEKQ